MLHINYKLNLFGTKESRRGMEGSGFEPGDRKGPKGGFGGGKPPRGGFGGPSKSSKTKCNANVKRNVIF